MQTQLEAARAGRITPQINTIAQNEGLSTELVRSRVAAGEIVVLSHPQRPQQRVVGLGTGLRTKVNASIGTSSDICDLNLEVRKAQIAASEGADTLMELSAAGDMDIIRRAILSAVDLPVGTVPLYQAFRETALRYGDPSKLDPELLFETIEKQLADGVSFMAIHCGINQYTIERLRKQGYRYGGLVSKGGTFMVAWMDKQGKENPLYEQFDRVCALMKKYDAVLSLGNGIRAGAIHDSHDRAQVAEMVTNCELAELGRGMGCQMMVEGPGHVPLDEIAANILLEKRMSGNAPYYVLGPLPLDSGAGYDHLSGAIGAAHAAWHGADLICYITPAEHLALPNEEDVRQGVRAARLAVRAGDLAKYPGRRENEKAAAKARRDMHWDTLDQHLLFPTTAQALRAERSPQHSDTCTMCGDFCAMKRGAALFRHDMSGDKACSV
ncbi:phosphomethylpyrimidine synthase ThiC [Candidatus Electronema sp. PJ]|uniref:phosphomethylpyrimidine synthase ThiC n=1 Tax=Candidatus Electronema sp. PJ TaxID=3401572 RepID=UPI003AA9AE0E